VTYAARISFLLLLIVLYPHQAQGRSSAAKSSSHVTVSSVWGVSLRHRCKAAVVRTIENALRAFQSTRITNTSECIAEDEKHFLAESGCARSSKIEIIRLASPASFNDAMRSSNSSRAVYEIIASIRLGYTGHPQMLRLGLGEIYGTGQRQTIKFSNVTSPVDFLRLGEGECTQALPPSAVPREI
jgi:hypothetical protein